MTSSPSPGGLASTVRGLFFFCQARKGNFPAAKPVSRPRRKLLPIPEQTNTDSSAPVPAHILRYRPSELPNDPNGLRTASVPVSCRQVFDPRRKSGSPRVLAGKKVLLRNDLMQRKSP